MVTINSQNWLALLTWQLSFFFSSFRCWIEQTNEHLIGGRSKQSNENDCTRSVPFDGQRNGEQNEGDGQKRPNERGELRERQKENYKQKRYDGFENDYVGEPQMNGREANEFLNEYKKEYENELINGYLANQSIDCDDPDKEADQFCDLCTNPIDRAPMASQRVELTDNCLGDDYDYHAQDYAQDCEPDYEQCEELNYAAGIFAKKLNNKTKQDDFVDDTDYLNPDYADYLKNVYDLSFMKEISLTERYPTSRVTGEYGEESDSSDRSNYLDDESNLKEEHFDDIHLLEEHSRSLRQEMTEFENELEFDYHDFENEDDCHFNETFDDNRQPIGQQRTVGGRFDGNGIGANKQTHHHDQSADHRGRSIVDHPARPTNRSNDHHSEPNQLNQSAYRPQIDKQSLHRGPTANQRADSSDHHMKPNMNLNGTNQTDQNVLASNTKADGKPNLFASREATDRADKNQSISRGPPKSGEQLEETISDEHSDAYGGSHGQLEFITKEFEKVSFCLFLRNCM